MERKGTVKKGLFLTLVVSAVVLVLYLRTGGFEFVRLDDPEYTFFNPFVYEGISWANLKTAFCNLAHGGIWMPVTYASYMLDISLFGRPAAAGGAIAAHHLVNVFVHGVNAVLLWRLLAALLRGDATGARPVFLAALLWAVHPLCAEPVCWISGRKELLWAFFTLIGLRFWIAGSGRFGCRAAAYACCAAACLSKPTAMCFPLLAWCVERTVSRGGRFDLRRDGPKYLPLLLMATVTGVIAIYSQSHAEGYDPTSLYADPAWRRALTALTACGMYLTRTVFPYGVHLDYARPCGGETVLGLCVLLAAATAAWRFRSARVPFGFAFFAVLPTLGIFGQFGEQAYADRFWYVPGMAVLAVLVLGIGRATFGLRERRGARSAFAAVAVVALFACICVTWRVTDAWRNDLTLFSRVLACDPENGRALGHVASETCARLGDLQAGIALYRKALARRPRFDTRAQLAYALARRGAEGDAAEILRLGEDVAKDVTLDRKGMMLEALGRAAAEMGRDADARRFLEASIRAPARFYSSAEAKALLKELP